MNAARIVDAHHHLWQPDPGPEPWRHQPWMVGPAAALQRPFQPSDLRPELEAAGISATVLVQTQARLEETHSMLDAASRTDFIAGVVGWADLTDPALDDTLSALQAREGGGFLVGIRHQVHDEADAQWLSRPDVSRGLDTVAAHGLVFDLLVRPRELPAALAAAHTHPELRFVIDHIGKPDIAAGAFEPWAEQLSAFEVEHDHVWCKLSGMVTEASPGHWTPADLRPYIRHALEVFGPQRCLFGSDWPVCTLAAGYGAVVDALLSNLADLDTEETDQVLAGSAIALYGLSLED